MSTADQARDEGRREGRREGPGEGRGERPGEGPTEGHLEGRLGRRGPWFAAVWLFFLIEPLLAGWARRDTASGLTGVVLTVLFAAVYMASWLRVRRLSWGTRGPASLPPPVFAGFLGLLVVLGAGMVLTLGEVGLTCVVYLAVTCVLGLRPRVAAAVVVPMAGATLLVGLLPGWGSQAGLAFSTLAASVAVYGVRAMLTRNAQLLREQQRNAELAVENERTRFARDLHDILGHSLTVITVKAELAGRLLDSVGPRDPADGPAGGDPVAAARAEVADLERLGRDALADVRRAVEGYRELTLPGEIARARAALAAAQVEADLPNATDEVPGDLREVFAWTVREGVTNVLRHSGARRCRIRVGSTYAEVRDDGCGTGGGAGGGAGAGAAAPTRTGAEASGSGLAGLRERAAAAGAVLVVRDLEPGFSLSVVRG